MNMNSLNFLSFEQTIDEINKLNPKKASQTTDTQTLSLF